MATNNHKPITNNQEPNKRTTVVVAPEGVSEEVWKAFTEQRKKSRAVISEVVINQIRKEADKLNWTLEQALIECVARGWRGFKADWIKPEQQNLSQTGQMNQRVISGLTRGLIGGGSNVKLLGS
jgi:hypothetical protein